MKGIKKAQFTLELENFYRFVYENGLRKEVYSFLYTLLEKKYKSEIKLFKKANRSKVKTGSPSLKGEIRRKKK